MTAPEWIAVLGALTVLVTAMTALFVQVRQLSIRVDGRLTQLLELTRTSSKAEGVLEGSPMLLKPAEETLLHRD